MRRAAKECGFGLVRVAGESHASRPSSASSVSCAMCASAASLRRCGVARCSTSLLALLCARDGGAFADHQPQPPSAHSASGRPPPTNARRAGTRSRCREGTGTGRRGRRDRASTRAHGGRLGLSSRAFWLTFPPPRGRSADIGAPAIATPIQPLTSPVASSAAASPPSAAVSRRPAAVLVRPFPLFLSPQPRDVAS